MKKHWKKLNSVSLDIDVAQWLEEVARRDNRSASNYVSTLLMRMRDGEMPLLPGVALEDKADGTPPAEAQPMAEAIPAPADTAETKTGAPAAAATVLVGSPVKTGPLRPRRTPGVKLGRPPRRQVAPAAA